MYRSANFKNIGQFGVSVCPPLCCRNAISPSSKPVSMGGKFVVPKSLFSQQQCNGLAEPEKFHGNVESCQLKRIRGKQGMENIMNCMENSPKTDFWLEPRVFEVKSKSALDFF
jgi:hypothetical protein